MRTIDSQQKTSLYFFLFENCLKITRAYFLTKKKYILYLCLPFTLSLFYFGEESFKALTHLEILFLLQIFRKQK